MEPGLGRLAAEKDGLDLDRDMSVKATEPRLVRVVDWLVVVSVGMAMTPSADASASCMDHAA